jgi:hypothetical protein
VHVLLDTIDSYQLVSDGKGQKELRWMGELMVIELRFMTCICEPFSRFLRSEVLRMYTNNCVTTFHRVIVQMVVVVIQV